MKAWLAFWSEGKNRRSKTFNAKVMGFEKARAAAIEFLKKKKQFLQQLDPTFGESGSPCLGDEEDFCEGSSMADSATTTSDSPNTSDISPCGACNAGSVENAMNSVGMRFFGAVDECFCGGSLVMSGNSGLH